MAKVSWVVILASLYILVGWSSGLREVEELHSWHHLTYLDREALNAEKAFFTGLQVWRDKIFVNIPRLYDGFPITFGWIPRNGDHPTFDQPIRPFPNYYWQEGEQNGHCNGFISTFRSRIDRCDRIWTIDSGKVNALDPLAAVAPRVPCPPRLMAFDLKTGQHVLTAALPPQLIRPTTTITYFSEEFVPGGGCDDIFFYLSDTLAAGLIVYDVRRNLFWRHEHKTFDGNPLFANSTLDGVPFSMADGLIGTTTATLHNERVLLFHAYSSLTLYYIPLRFVNDPEVRDLPIRVLRHQTSQEIPLTTDENNNVYFSPITETALYRWNPDSSLPPHMVAQDAQKMQVLADFSFVGDQIWFSSNKLQYIFGERFFNNSQSTANLRIMRLGKHL